LRIARVLRGRLNGRNMQLVLSSWLLRIPCVYPLGELDEYLHIFLWFYVVIRQYQRAKYVTLPVVSAIRVLCGAPRVVDVRSFLACFIQCHGCKNYRCLRGNSVRTAQWEWLAGILANCYQAVASVEYESPTLIVLSKCRALLTRLDTVWQLLKT